MAVLALVLGLLALVGGVFCLVPGPICGVPAVIVGLLAHRRITSTGGAVAGANLALAGWICGLAGILVAIIHGVLGETKVFARATIQPESLRTLIRLVWQAGTVAWIGGGVLLIVAPSLGSESARHWITATIIVVYGFGIIANAWWSRGRGFGWKALGVVVALAVAGY